MAGPAGRVRRRSDPAEPSGLADRVRRCSASRIRLRQAGVDPAAGGPADARKPPWLRVAGRMGAEFLGLRRTMRDLDLVTVCEEAGCPNIFECWADGTATFMINGERCTRACGFCLVDTRHPLPLDPGEPDRVAAAVARTGPRPRCGDGRGPRRPRRRWRRGLRRHHRAIRRRCPATAVEVLIPDCKGDADVARDDLRRRGPTSSTTTSRPWPACSAPFAPRPATPAVWPCWPGPRTPG